MVYSPILKGNTIVVVEPYLHPKQIPGGYIVNHRVVVPLLKKRKKSLGIKSGIKLLVHRLVEV